MVNARDLPQICGKSRGFTTNLWQIAGTYLKLFDHRWTFGRTSLVFFLKIFIVTSCIYTSVHAQLVNAHSLFSDTAIMVDDMDYLDSDAESVKQNSGEYDDDDGLDEYVPEDTTLQAARARALLDAYMHVCVY